MVRGRYRADRAGEAEAGTPASVLNLQVILFSGLVLATHTLHPSRYWEGRTP